MSADNNSSISSNKRLLPEDSVEDSIKDTESFTKNELKRNLNETTNTCTNTRTTTTTRLLLAAPNGVFPYLTPSLAERYFGSFGKEGSNQLWLGVAVRDTCVVPSFGTKTTSNKKTNGVVVDLDKTARLTKKNHTSNDDDEDKIKKPTGYSISFTASIKSSAATSGSNNKDEAVMPFFTHVTVPSFDLLQEELDYQLLLKQPKPKRNAIKSPPPPPPPLQADDTTSAAADTTSTTTTTSSVESTNRHVMVWTPHGRQMITPDQYRHVAQGLDSSYTLTLYDQCHVKSAATSRRRRQYMRRRNAEWLYHGIDQTTANHQETLNALNNSLPSTISTNNNSKYFVPWVMSDEEVPTHDNGKLSASGENQLDTLDESTLSLLLQQHSNLAGVALIGWPHLTLQEQHQRPPWLSSFLGKFQESNLAISNQAQQQQQQQQRDPLLLLVLQTLSLLDIIHAMELGAHVIGTSLPMTWAQQHKAFVLDFDHFQESSAKKSSISNTLEHDAKRPRLDPSEPQNVIECDEHGCWDMSQKVFQLDQRPLVQGCTCFACRSGGDPTPPSVSADSSASSLPLFHSPPTPPTCRAYLHHLVNTQELLGEMLLFAHNLHHMLRFFQHASQNIQPQDFPAFRQYLLDQLPATQPAQANDKA